MISVGLVVSQQALWRVTQVGARGSANHGEFPEDAGAARMLSTMGAPPPQKTARVFDSARKVF